MDIGGTIKRAYCKCGNLTASKGRDSQGRQRWRSQCYTCLKRASKYKKTYCEVCFVTKAEMGTLDIDHIDGDRSNNEEWNLQTLCRPCHVKKSRENGDVKGKYKNGKKNM